MCSYLNDNSYQGGKIMKKKINYKRILLTFIGFLIVAGLTIENPINLQVEAAVVLPQVSIVSLDHSPFVEGDKNEFFIASKGYTGKVQYQLFYTCETTMGSKWQLIYNSNMSNGWTSAVSGQEPIKVDISNLKLNADYYRFAIRVRRVGIKGKFSNSYGDYDSAYPFTMDVLKTKDINLNGDMLINKNDFTQKENLKIQGTSTDTSNVQYKLHLYDVKNDKWLTNLTEYSDNVDYDLTKLSAGTYIVDIWAKNKQSTNKYDGWKLSVINVKNETVPKVSIVSLEHYPFVEKDNNEFFISSKDYSGKVQYQLFYTNDKTMNGKWELINNEDMVDEWTKPTNTSEPVKVNLSKLNLKPELYRFAIRVRRVGVEGKYKNQYGNYDDAYPFNVTVSSNANIKLSGNLLMDKTDYGKNDQLKISGIEGAAQNTKYMLHLYDTVNNKWLTNLTDYSDKIDYDLSNIPEGTYIVDVWGKNSSGAQKYDGWKLKVIKVTSDLVKISNVEDTKVIVKRNARYVLPQSVTVTLEDGSKLSKPVEWNTQVDTRKAGVYELYGTVLGSDKKAKLTLVVEETMGNTSGNILNLGIVAEKDGWIFYSNYSDDGKLYKANKDGKNITKVCDDNAFYINVVGDWIYYANTLDELKIYKIKTDGTNRTKILGIGAEQITVVNDWIYFINDLEDFKIYKVKTDGTALTKINNDESINLNFKDDFIYYSNLSDDGKIYKIRIDGVGRTKVNNDTSAFINVVEDWIYYCNASDNQYVYKIKTNGTERTRVIDEAATFLNVTNDSIYYLDLLNEGRVVRRDLTGSRESRKLQSWDFGFFINVIDNLVFYGIEEDDFIHYVLRDEVSMGMRFGIDIVSVRESNLTVRKGNTRESLMRFVPSTVSAIGVDGREKILPVSWNIGEIDTTKEGEYVYEATLPGYKVKALLKIKIIEM